MCCAIHLGAQGGKRTIIGTFHVQGRSCWDVLEVPLVNQATLDFVLSVSSLEKYAVKE
jgi:hypothetical protein